MWKYTGISIFNREADDIWLWEAVTLKSVVELNMCFVLGGRETKTIIRKKKMESGEKRVK